MTQLAQSSESVPLCSFIICTFARANLLEHCLLSLLRNPDFTFAKYEILVVDNANDGPTKELCHRLDSQIRYILEPRIGLSIARNTGGQEAKGTYLGYLDDDAKIHPDFFVAMKNLPYSDYDCFGGVYLAWFPFGRPKWLPSNFGNKIKLLSHPGVLEDGYLSGNLFFVKKEVLFNVGGFRTDLGMVGHRIWYGEEDELQDRIRAANYSIGFSPDLKIDHAVLPQKLTLSWHLKQSFVKGRMRQMRSPKPGSQLWMECFSVILLFPVRMLYHGFRWLFQSDFYWQNFVLFTVGSVTQTAGVTYQSIFGTREIV